MLELGAAANAERERRHGQRVYFSQAPLAAYKIPADENSASGEAEIRAIAQARLDRDDPHIAADWTGLTPYLAQVALRFGADTLTGIPPGTPRQEVVRLIVEAGREPFECDANFQPHESAWESPLTVLHS